MVRGPHSAWKTQRSCNARVGYRRLPSVTVGYVGYRPLPSVTVGYWWLPLVTISYCWSRLVTLYFLRLPSSGESSALLVRIFNVALQNYHSRLVFLTQQKNVFYDHKEPGGVFVNTIKQLQLFIYDSEGSASASFLQLATDFDSSNETILYK